MIPAGFLKVGLSLAALFVFGGICGFAVATRRMSNPAVRAQLEDRWIETRRREDAIRLKLTAEQQERVRPLYQQMLGDVRTVRETAGAGVIEAAKKQGRGMWSLLTPDQQQEFLRLSEERRALLHKKGSS